MEKTRKIKTLYIIVLILAVLGLTVAFAALSGTLTIRGTSNINPGTWDVRYIDLSLNDIVGDAKEISAPSISADGRSITGVNVSLKKPGDMISYYYDIKNFGTINAKLNNVYINNIPMATNGELSEAATEILSPMFNSASAYAMPKSVFTKCDWDGDGTTTESEKDICSSNIMYISYDIFNMGDVVEPNRTLSSYNTLLPTDYLLFGVMYNKNATSLPTGEVEISISISDEFVQAD